MADLLRAGAAALDISPEKPTFLWGYPNVERMSAGVHDPLMSTALYFSDGRTETVLIGNDLIFVGKALAANIRRRIEQATGIPAAHIMITATHTHSGPTIVNYLSNEDDPIVPPADEEYLSWIERRIAENAIAAKSNAVAARIGLTRADGRGVGTNRIDPDGPCDPEIPVMAVRSAEGERLLALMTVYSMHPTVLHEDFKFVSADFPGATRRYLQSAVGDDRLPVIYHNGPSGNLSTRHVVKANTASEMERLGAELGRRIAGFIDAVRYRSSIGIECRQAFLELEAKSFPSVEEAETKLNAARDRFEGMRHAGAPRAETRTAECDLFGAEETLSLSRAARDGRMAKAQKTCMPAEIQIVAIGPWKFVAWPGECFVEYALDVKAKSPETFVIALANGELQGYIATEAAAAEGGYEASNALFSHENGPRLVERTLALLATFASSD